MKKYLLTILLIASLTKFLQAQTFTKSTINITQNSFTSWGSSWIDYDNDGDLDLFVNDKDQHRLYRNDDNGVFTNITPANLASPAPLGFYYTSAWGDYNNDGFLDLYIGNDGDKNALLQGGAGGVFTAITTGPEVADMYHSFNVSWVDYNNDGFLDLFASNLGNEKNNLYRNNNGTSFSKITTGNIVNDIDESWCQTWADYDNDRCPDLFVGNINNDFLYHNNCDGTFTKVTAGSIVNDAKDSESASWGDYNNDGYLDLFVSVWGDKSMLYKNNGDGTFTKILNSPVVSHVNSGTSSGWADYDNDGDLDLYTCSWNNEQNHMYSNNGDGTFMEITSGPLVDDSIPNNGCTWADIDNDGDQDLYLTNKAHANDLFVNNGNGNSWINIKCIGIASNRSAIGTKVSVKAMINGIPVWQMREIGGMTGQFSQSGMNAAFGFGNATVLDSVNIEWNSGANCYFTNVPVNQFLSIDENCSIMTVGINEVASSTDKDLTAFPNPFVDATVIPYVINATSDVTLDVIDISGRKVIHTVNKNQAPGLYQTIVSGQQLSVGGLYVYRLTVDSHIYSGKINYTRP